MVNQSRRKFLWAAGAAPTAAALSGCAQFPLAKEFDFSDRIATIDANNTTGFDRKKAIENLCVAVLPENYVDEVVIRKRLTHEQAMEEMRSRFPDNAEITLMRHENTTAVIVYQPDLHKVTIAYNGTHEKGDIVDNAKYFPVSHPLGGMVHWGYKAAIGFTGGKDHPETIHDRITNLIESYAAREDELDVSLTGFSRGGALAVATAAEWFAQGIPGDRKTHLTDVQTFEALAYGTDTFVKAFEKKAAENGTKLTRLVLGNDFVPRIADMVPFPKFRHAGDVVYVMPGKEKNTTDILINPTGDELKYRLASLPNIASWHNINLLAKLLGAPEAYVAEGQDNVQQQSRVQVEKNRRTALAGTNMATVTAQR